MLAWCVLLSVAAWGWTQWTTSPTEPKYSSTPSTRWSSLQLLERTHLHEPRWKSKNTSQQVPRVVEYRLILQMELNKTFIIYWPQCWCKVSAVAVITYLSSPVSRCAAAQRWRGRKSPGGQNSCRVTWPTVCCGTTASTTSCSVATAPSWASKRFRWGLTFSPN